eukprot:jgi/Mesen1/7422/ME000388S06640
MTYNYRGQAAGQAAGMEVDGRHSNRRFTGGSGRGGHSSNRSGQSNNVCRFYMAGHCTKGDQCNWYHPSPSERVAQGGGGGGRAAGGFTGGGSGGGGFSGSKRSNSAVATNGTGGERWGRPRGASRGGGGGRGGFGDRSKQRTRACNYWLRGSCTKGDNCNFLHSHATAPDIEMMTELKGHEKCVNVVSTGGDVGSLITEGGYLFVGLRNEVKLWNMQTGQDATLAGPSGDVHALLVHNNVLFAGCHDGSILAWQYSATSGTFEPAASLTGHTAAVVALEKAGGRMYSGSMDKTIRVWDLTNGQCLQTLTEHTHVVMGVLCWEAYLLSCSLDGTVKGALALAGSVDAGNKPVLLVAYNDSTVRLFDLPTFTDRGLLFTREDTRTIHFSSQLLFTGDNSGDVKVWRWITPPAMPVV